MHTSRRAARGSAAAAAPACWALLAMLLASQALAVVAQRNNNTNMNNFDNFGNPAGMMANNGNNDNNNFGWGGLPASFINDPNWAMFQMNPFQGPARTGNPARDSAAEQARLQQVQAALHGDPAMAAVVAPSLLLASSILLTVSPSLATASTGVGIASALIGNIAAWTRWINQAGIFFLELGDNRRRNLLATDGDGTDSEGADDADTQLARSQLLEQMRSATSQMRDWGSRVGTLRKGLQTGERALAWGQFRHVRWAELPWVAGLAAVGNGGGEGGGGPFQQYLADQRSALKTARDALTAVQNTQLGHALGLTGVGLPSLNSNQWLTQLRSAAQTAAQSVGAGVGVGGGGAAGTNFMQRMAEMMGKAFQG
ncbi:hypothetical protein HXX76_011849 [Chlamydomonas incerta]|uniref:Uncharacterized protein n=1 Tax=Chlamydomonas incerta TaxID=51695 RepID=A0A835SJI7_CHLIN|nr:hypothetical protein HXX76_011849 [Chlamydomonas incerta]|eukprot:KAG2428169.1 hypothetical protein HXX76_011849 [Chlamydomonas incerta]